MVSISPFPNPKIQHVFLHDHSNNTAHLLRSSNWPFPSVAAVFELKCRIYATVILTMSNTCRSLRRVHLFLLTLYLVLLNAWRSRPLIITSAITKVCGTPEPCVPDDELELHELQNSLGSWPIIPGVSFILHSTFLLEPPMGSDSTLDGHCPSPLLNV